jgi:hypothetical protein
LLVNRRLLIYGTDRDMDRIYRRGAAASVGKFDVYERLADISVADEHEWLVQNCHRWGTI